MLTDLKGAVGFFYLPFNNKMDNKIRTAIEIAIWIITLWAVSYGVYASSYMQEQKEINDLKQQLAESLEREATAKLDYDHCKVVMDNAHQQAEAERELQFSINEQLMEKVGLIESR